MFSYCLGEWIFRKEKKNCTRLELVHPIPKLKQAFRILKNQLAYVRIILLILMMILLTTSIELNISINRFLDQHVYEVKTLCPHTRAACTPDRQALPHCSLDCTYTLSHIPIPALAA